MTATTLPIRKDFTRIEDPCGSKAALTRFISAISSGESSRSRNGALVKPMPCSPLMDPSSATTPSNKLRTARVRARCASRSCSSRLGHHDVDVNVAVACVAERRNRQPHSCRMRSTSANSSGTRPRGTTTSLLSFTGEILLQRRREFAPQIPDVARARLRTRRAGSAIAPAARHASSHEREFGLNGFRPSRRLRR